MKLAPIIYFAYNRPDHTLKTLGSLSNNKEVEQSELHCFIDGPKAHRYDEDKRKIQSVIDVIKSKQWCKKVIIYENIENHGCAAQTINNVSRMTAEYGKVIVLEDDNLLSPFFLDFINKSLEIYKDEKRAMSVSGFLYPVKKLTIDSGFMAGTGSYGWGTWERAWKYFEPDASKLISRLSDKKIRYKFDYNNSAYYYRMLQHVIDGRIEGWDIRFHASVFLNNGLTLFPGQSLVRNIGFDNSGIHCPTTTIFDTEILNRPITKYPDVIEESEELLNATIDFFRSIKPTILSRIKNRAKRLLDKIRG